jgi:hypothetical protein
MMSIESGAYGVFEHTAINKKEKQYFPADFISREETLKLGMPEHISEAERQRWRIQNKIVAVRTGEKRPPKKGEWYLSGAIIHAYQAGQDLTCEYHIARLVKVRVVTVIEEIP